jgi:ParB family transcriptional regulator, chromosome partitioning protein
MSKRDHRENPPRKALGRGMGALLPTRSAPPPAAQSSESSASQAPPEPAPSEVPFTIPIDQIDPNPLQPRRVFEQEKLEELAESIRHNGIVQPLVVRRVPEPSGPDHDRYQLIAGERRLRAAKLAGLAEVPAVVRDVPDHHLLEITLIENIQREDLNPIETAQAFQRLGSDLFLSLEDIAHHTGKDRSTVLNLMRLLQLPKEVQQLVVEHKITAGHARCLLGLPTTELSRGVAQKIVSHGWSVRQVERVVQKIRRQADGLDRPAEPDPPLDPNVKAALQAMEQALGTKVRIVEKAKKGGRIEIEYYSTDDLNRIYAVITGVQ